MSSSCPDDTAPQARILAAATRLFLSHGFAAATTDMIQREAGVSKATLYACHGSKEALFEAVVETACDALMARFDAIECRPGQLEQTLTRLGRTYLEILLCPASLTLYRAVVAESVRFPHLARIFYLAAPKRSVERVAGHLDAAARAGELDLQAVGVTDAAAVFIGLLRGEGHTECVLHPEARPSAAQIDDWVRLAVSTFLRAYAHRPERP